MTGLAWPLCTSSLFNPRRSAPMLSPACPWSNIFLNISTPVHVVLTTESMPEISSCFGRRGHEERERDTVS